MMSLDGAYVASFIVGLLGGVHCAGMCGGIVGALTLQLARTNKPLWPLHVAYSIGRIATYTLLGMILGGLASIPVLYDRFLPIQLTFYVLAQIMLMALGLYLLGVTQLLAPLERGGQMLWQHIQPLTRRFLPVQNIRQAVCLGSIWGLIPCGMVYSVLTTAILTGSALRGGEIMLAFGLGTLPNLLLAGLLLKRFRDFTQNKTVRWISGVLVLGFGLYGLMMIEQRATGLWRNVMC